MVQMQHDSKFLLSLRKNPCLSERKPDGEVDEKRVPMRCQKEEMFVVGETC